MTDFRIATMGTNVLTLAQAKSEVAIQGLRNQPAKDRPSKIDKAAHDFESILVGQWLEKAEKSFATVPGANPDQDRDSGHDQYQSIACESLAQGLSKTGVFGIAAMISKHLATVEAKSDEAPNGASGSSSQVRLGVPNLNNNK